MALVHPDTTKAPVWRRQPRRVEAPITAWRAWDVRPTPEGWKLNSLAASFAWEGPFAQSDARPVDPKLWDEAKKRDPNEGKHVLVHVFSVAGIHAVNTIELAEDITSTYACAAHGEVALWGRIAVFELGYRAEFCMIKKLWVQTHLLTSDERVNKAIVRDLSNRYECDVEIV